MPVPYNIQFELNIFSKLNDDALQIIEQIFPYFQPAFNLTVDLVSSIGEKRDIPIILDSIDFQDDYEGSFQTRRALIYTLRFTAKTYLFGPVAESSEVSFVKFRQTFTVIQIHKPQNVRLDTLQFQIQSLQNQVMILDSLRIGISYQILKNIVLLDNKIFDCYE